MCILTVVLNGLFNSSTINSAMVSDASKAIIATTIATSTVLSGIVYSDIATTNSAINPIVECTGQRTGHLAEANEALGDQACSQDSALQNNLVNRSTEPPAASVTSFQPAQITEQGGASL